MYSPTATLATAALSAEKGCRVAAVLASALLCIAPSFPYPVPLPSHSAHSFERGGKTGVCSMMEQLLQTCAPLQPFLSVQKGETLFPGRQGFTNPLE